MLLVLFKFTIQSSIGLNEDSVTGSALCALAPYYHQKYNAHLVSPLSAGPVYLQSYQASQRGGKAQVALLQSVDNNNTDSVEDSVDRVLISGHCVTIMHSMFTAV
jgi:predicted PhzF superfamily epimerase YddE/YHI9